MTPRPEAVVLIGEIGGSEENRAADYLQKSAYGKPVIAYVAGLSAPADTRMGHAGAIVENGLGTAAEKMRALAAAGAQVVESPVSIGARVVEALRR